MEIITDVNWWGVIISTIVLFVIGWAWYSEKLFATGWKAGIGHPVKVWPMALPMTAQLAGTFLVSWLVAVAHVLDSGGLAVLIALALGAIVKANGMFAGKNKYAVMVDTTYVLVMVLGAWIIFNLF